MKTPVQRLAVARPALPLSDVQDLVYIANISIGDVSFPVQLDTGSSDLWVLPTSGYTPNAEASSISLNLTYGAGWAQGQVATASAEFAGITVPRQAYLNVSTAWNPALSYGAAGILGLGFSSLSSIDLALGHSGSSSGQTLLYNLFRDNPNEPNFISFSLQSTSDGDDVQGILTVGETDPSYANVTTTNKIPTWPASGPSRWTILLDSFVVGTQMIPVSSAVPAAPANKAVILLDSGTSYTYVPTDVCTAIYGGIAGAAYDSTLGKWTIPCNVEIDMALQIDNQVFPIHPLDVTPALLGSQSDCLGSFVPQTVSVASGQFDWLIGDNVLRSIYTLFDYGDFDSSGNMGRPYVQMLPLINPDQASVEFHQVRGGTPNTNITYGVADSGSGPATISVSTDAAAAIQNLSNYLPPILAITALNTLILITLVVVGVVFLCKRRRKVRTRRTPGRLSPMPLGNPCTSVSRATESFGDVPHTYQPVSMALTEDTLFTPPMPGFKTDASRFQSRPNSIA